MKIKIKSTINIIGHEELYVIPITSNKSFLLGLNFYEDIQGGRTARFIIAYDKYGEINDTSIISGDKGIVEAELVEESYSILSSYIKIDKYLKTNKLPFFINIEIKKENQLEDRYSRGIQGYLNYVRKYGEIDAIKIKDIIKLDVEELI